MSRKSKLWSSSHRTDESSGTTVLDSCSGRLSLLAEDQSRQYNQLLGQNDEQPKHEPKQEPVHDPDDCCYSLCERPESWFQWMTCGRFKAKNDRAFCVLFSLTIISLLVAVIVPLVIDRLVNDGVNQVIIVDSDSATSYETWQTNAQGAGLDDVVIKYKLYFPEVQNPDEVLRGAKPVISEVGPYTYREYYNKFDIEFTNEGDTVTFNTQRYYVFSPQESGPGLTEDDYLTIPYPAVIGFQYFLQQLPAEQVQTLEQKIMGGILGIESIITGKINELYEKVDDKRLLKPSEKKEIENLLHHANDTVHNIFNKLIHLTDGSDFGGLVLKTLMCGIPSGISPFFKARPGEAWFGMVNDPLMNEVLKLTSAFNLSVPLSPAIPGAAINYTTIEETRRRRTPDIMKTGKKNRHQISQYVRFNNMTEYWVCLTPLTAPDMPPYKPGEEYPACPQYQAHWSADEAKLNGYVQPFNGSYANQIGGSDANMFGRPVTSDKLKMFSSDVYRSIFLEHKEDLDYKGLTVRRFQLQDKDLMNSTVNPENELYFQFGPNGIQNVSAATGAPVFISFPHFYRADPQLASAIKGMKPTQEDHETFMDVEPYTGLLIRAKKRLQANYRMTSYKMPQIDNETVEYAQSICNDISKIIEILKHNIPIAKDSLPADFSCEDTLLTPFYQCLAQPSNWQLQNDEIYMPFGYASEEVEMSDSTTEMLSTSVFDTQDFADQVRLWALVCAGIFFSAAAAMFFFQHHHETKEELEANKSKKKSKKMMSQKSRDSADRSSHLNFAFSPNYDQEDDRKLLQQLLDEEEQPISS